MSIARMRKVTVIACQEALDRVVDALQECGVVDVATTEFELPTVELAADDTRLAQVEDRLARAQRIREILEHHHTNEQPMAMFVSEKFHLDEDTYRQTDWTDEYEMLYHQCEDLLVEIAASKAELETNETSLHSLYAWQECDVPFSQWHGTQQTSFYAGVCSSEVVEILQRRLSETGIQGVDIDVYDTTGSNVAIIIRMLDCDEMQLRVLLGELKITEAVFEGSTSIPAVEIADLEGRNAFLHERLEEIDRVFTDLAKEYFTSVIVLLQVLESARDRLVVRTRFARTAHTIVISGWIREIFESNLASGLDTLGAEIDLTIDDPQPDDIVPVELENPKWLRPFELLTDLYGRPPYGGIDPTGALAPFFAFFFAICIGDVGYGLMLMATSLAIMRFLDVAPNVKRFCWIMLYGAVMTIPVGVLTGSYFALPAEALPSFLLRLKLIDPLNQITVFLILMLIVGVIQIFTGILIAAWSALRGGKWQVALGGQISIFVLFGSIGLFFLTGLRHPWFIYGGILATALLQGFGLFYQADPEDRTIKKAILSFFGGFYEVYGLTAVLNDSLSYTRLAALGLSGALVGMVFNILAGLVWGPAQKLIATGGLGYLWALLLGLGTALVFVIGHVFNVVINLLGAFVHPMRLQFVEFFNWFYTGGGIPFKPFTYKKEGLVFEENAGRIVDSSALHAE